MYTYAVNCIKHKLNTVDNVLEHSCPTVFDMHVMMRSLTVKLGVVRGLVGDGVEDLVDLGVEIWLLETPFAVWTENKGRGFERAFW